MKKASLTSSILLPGSPAAVALIIVVGGEVALTRLLVRRSLVCLKVRATGQTR